jgi:hypothetical protein
MMVRRGPAVAQAEAFPLRDILFFIKAAAAAAANMAQQKNPLR